MWFLKDITIRQIQPIHSQVIKCCEDNGIKVRFAVMANRLWDYIEDEDYPRLIDVLQNNGSCTRQSLGAIKESTESDKS